ncbi:hypothetical protein D9619_000400 [Psilocybe cf. subviscida]|uniref:Secreted protein n=1 Tax=Psilocybe cf. subviscida TaxID=2480587 RepID=A0A8H5BEA0_9AGAR|nr:hypothetical protein D9619_000400 [Psilocybe cf. subviscida]
MVLLLGKLLAAAILMQGAVLGVLALSPSQYTTGTFTPTPTVTTPIYPTGTAGCWLTTVVVSPSPYPGVPIGDVVSSGVNVVALHTVVRQFARMDGSAPRWASTTANANRLPQSPELLQFVPK